MPAPLEGLLVVDLSRVLAGPLAAMTLGDLGTDVVKVESPAGDDTRRWKPPADAQGRASYHHAANRNKRSVALDMTREEDLALARFGPDHETIARANPRVIHCAISGFGEAGGRDLPGYAPIVQAVGGLMTITGPPEEPSKVGVAIVDVVTALYATVAVLAALHARRETGRGQRV